ncbi:MAG: adaptor protein MecA [Clostridia bacterium]|nr:adaptor protein MecA [Clostridia bacterium]
MLIEKIDESKLLISLGKYDIEKLELNEEKMTLSNPEFKETLKAILSVAMLEADIKPSGKRVKIEAMPYDKGCFIIVSFLNRRSKRYTVRKKKNFIYRFDDFEDIITLAQSFSKSDIKIGANSVFECDGVYYLFVEDCSQETEKIIELFSEKYYPDSITNARFSEYGNVIAKNNALLKINNAFIK